MSCQNTDSQQAQQLPASLTAISKEPILYGWHLWAKTGLFLTLENTEK